MATWTAKLNADSPPGLGPEGILVTCQRLSLYDMGRRPDARQAIELFATGNTLVEGETFTARAQNITYATAKGLLVMEGEGRSEARLWVRNRVGQPDRYISAGRMLYSTRTQELRIHNLGPLTIPGS